MDAKAAGVRILDITSNFSERCKGSTAFVSIGRLLVLDKRAGTFAPAWSAFLLPVSPSTKGEEMTDPGRYSAISTINHWVTALLVVVMLVLGFAAGAAPSEAIAEYVMAIHISLGFFVLIFVAWRVMFRLYEGFPANVGPTAMERWAAYLVHRAILILLALQVVSGPMYLFTENECMDVFGWFSVCVPLESLSIIHEPMEWIHLNIGIYVLPALLMLHFLGAIRHYAVDKRQETPSDL